MLSTTFDGNQLYIVEKEEDGKHYFEAMKLINKILFFFPTAVVNIFDDNETIVCRDIGLNIPMQCYACVTLNEDDVESVKALLKN